MTKTVALAPLLTLEKNREQQAVKAFGDAQFSVAGETQKLKQLMDYRGEYERMVTEKGSQGISASRLQDYHRFLNRLTDAINQQQQQLELAKQQQSDAQQNWFEQRISVKRMNTLLERHEQQNLREADKREQKELDEQAQRTLYYP